jgi:hypothetical protein
MTRVDNWPGKLNEYINATRDNKFEWGTHDCCTWTAGAVKVLTGEDHMLQYMGTYNDKETADELIDSLGYGDLYRALIEIFGPPLEGGAGGQRGDVAFYEGCCGIVIGRHGMFIGEDGYTLVPLLSVQRIFKVN